uniref:rhodanese-like domain-containing protein 4A, chloroplastic n=1 Tax=Erigeron canadensis TaxID=72917 RepID=UPI001CB8F1AD|nr:rhodanese-like domain-containing protein 4A, chloroplastic [Erigeron canadensis]
MAIQVHLNYDSRHRTVVNNVIQSVSENKAAYQAQIDQLMAPNRVLNLNESNVGDGEDVPYYSDPGEEYVSPPPGDIVGSPEPYRYIYRNNGDSTLTILSRHISYHFTSLLFIHYLSVMESLSIGLSSSPKTTSIFKTPKPIFLKFTPNSIHINKKHPKSTNPFLQIKTPSLKIQTLSFLFTTFHSPLSLLASENQPPVFADSAKINLEQIVVSIDDFFNKYPFFVAGVVFIWLYVIPVSQEYLRKYKYISAIDAFKKIKDDPNAQMLDIRDGKTLRVLGSPNLKIFGKNVVQVEFVEGDDDEGFVKKVKEQFEDYQNTSVYILDNFDGNSMNVAELLFKNGFKEAYAIRGGVRGNNGWLEIQETLLPPSVHIYLKAKLKKSIEANNNGAIEQESEVKSQLATVAEIKQTNGYANTSAEQNTKSLSPYSMYPNMKPPSSPTPSKPQ